MRAPRFNREELSSSSLYILKNRLKFIAENLLFKLRFFFPQKSKILAVENFAFCVESLSWLGITLSLYVSLELGG
ncbi:MAG: hypothetical protein KKA79_07975, partial [Nanoarchaeota archaeon]|nr:hypothetical protein [Nanoarchaeota archaeon]